MLDSETKKRSGSWVVGIAAAAAIAVVVAVYLWVHRGPPEAPPAEPVAQAPAPAPDVRLPTAEESDARIRREAANLSPRPELADWLKQSGLLERWVAVTDNLAEGVSPRKQLQFLAPSQPFKVQQKGSRT